MKIYYTDFYYEQKKRIAVFVRIPFYHTFLFSSIIFKDSYANYLQNVKKIFTECKPLSKVVTFRQKTAKKYAFEAQSNFRSQIVEIDKTKTADKQSGLSRFLMQYSAKFSTQISFGLFLYSIRA